MSVVVVATVVPLAQHRDAVIAAFERAVARVHVEDPGCELYALHEGAEQLVMIEKWTSPDHLATHAKAHAVAELDAAIEGMLARPTEVRTYLARPAGTATQGVL